MITRNYLTALLILLSTTALAENQSIISANNQASINLLFQNQTINYTNNINNYPLYDVHGNPYGLDFTLSKTFYRLYTAINMSATTADLSYNDPSLDRSNATGFLQQINARLGYSYDVSNVVSITPYLILGYQHWQLDTGGLPNLGTRTDGITQITQSIQYGAGLLSQWAVTPRWVLAADFTVFNNDHTWTYASVPINSDIFYQEATLSPNTLWQLGISSDYKITSNLHALLGVKYLNSNTGSGYTNDFDIVIPSQKNHTWQYSAGLGYDLDNLPTTPTIAPSTSRILTAANNQASLNAGYLFQEYGEFLSGESGYLDRQTGEIPQIKMAVTKTWKNIYGQLTLSEAVGYTEYNGSDVFTGDPISGTIRNTMTDVSGRLGYQVILTPIFSITPYGTLGYHRWLRSISYPETYHHNWAGVGALLQLAPTSKLVLSLDGNTGQTFNAQLHAWNTFFPPNTLLLPANLGSRSYVIAGMGGDYNFYDKWHFLANLNYWRFNYGKSSLDEFGIYEPDSNTRLLAAMIGIGYELD